MFEMVDDKGQKALIKVIGVGGCGGNAIDFMIEKNVQGVEFICINTDLQHQSLLLMLFGPCHLPFQT